MSESDRLEGEEDLGFRLKREVRVTKTTEQKQVCIAAFMCGLKRLDQ